MRKRLKKSAQDDVHDTDGMLSDALTQWRKRSAKQEDIQVQTLQLAVRRDEREQQQLAEQLVVERAKLKHSERTVDIQERQQALQMMKDPDPDISAEGRRMLRELAKRSAPAAG